MKFDTLGDFINLLEARGQLKRIAAPVSPLLEITEITDRVIKGPPDHNKALLFENLPGFTMPVLINAYGSAQRMAWALGVEDLDELNAGLSKVIDLRLPRGFQELVNRGRDLFQVFKSIGLRPKKVRQAPVQQVIHIEDATLEALPILKCWPKDGGRVHHPAAGDHP